jgi:hypothetical protein
MTTIVHSFACQRGSLVTISKHSQVYTRSSHNFERNSMVTSVSGLE